MIGFIDTDAKGAAASASAAAPSASTTSPPAPAAMASAPKVGLNEVLSPAVRRVVAGLPPAQQEVVQLRHERGLTFQEIADRLRRPLGTVLTQMRAGLAKIAVALEAYR